MQQDRNPAIVAWVIFKLQIDLSGCQSQVFIDCQRLGPISADRIRKGGRARNPLLEVCRCLYCASPQESL